MVKYRYPPESIMAEAQKYDTRQAFHHGSPREYEAAYRRGLLESVCAHMAPALRTWTDESLVARAREFDSRKQLQDADPSAYALILRRGLTDTAFSHMLTRGHTVDSVLAAAQSCKTRSEFYTLGGVYHAAKRLRVVDAVNSLLPDAVGHSAGDEVEFYWYHHPEGDVYFGIASDAYRRHEWHLEKDEGDLRWLVEHGDMEVLKDAFGRPITRTRSDARRIEARIIRYLADQRWRVWNKNHNPQYNRSTATWDHPPRIPLHVQDRQNA